MDPDLLRQRRNLISISAVLLIFDFAQVKITKVSVLGTELLVGNVQVLMVCAWLLWAYFLLRYYQYWQLQSEQHIRSTLQNRMDLYARKYTKAKPIQDLVGMPFDSYKITRIGLIKWSYTLQGYNFANGGIEDGPSFPMPRWKLVIWLLKSIVYLILQTPHATNHILPFALAFAAPIITLCMKIQ